jgi:hypothetical protein
MVDALLDPSTCRTSTLVTPPSPGDRMPNLST